MTPSRALPAPSRWPPAWGAAVLAGTLLAGAAAHAEDQVVRVPTTYVRADAEVQQGAQRVASARGERVPFGMTPPPRTRRVPEAASRYYGTLPIGPGRMAVFGVTGTQGVLGIDLDGDLAIAPTEELCRGPGLEARSRSGPVLRWQWNDTRLGPARADVAVQLQLPSWTVHARRAGTDVAVPLTESPPDGLRLPALPGARRYGALPTSAGSVPLAIVRQADRLTVLLDGNRDGTVAGPTEVRPAAVHGQTAEAMTWGIDVETGGERISIRVVESLPKLMALVRPGGARRGEIQLQGRRFLLHVLDADLDGRYDSAGDSWWFGSAEDLAGVRSLTPDAMVEATEAIRLEKPWRLMDVDAEGNAVVMEDPTAPPVGEWLHRRSERVNRERWFPRFDEERQTFFAHMGLDPSRPRAPRPVSWMHDVDLAAALARARAEGKPVLADFEADWCVWCKRFDYYVYPDAEVAQWLSKFVTVKINAEFNRAGDLQRLGAKGLPFIVVLRDDGTPVEFTMRGEDGQEQTISGPPGFQTPQDFVTTLRAAYAAWKPGR